MPWIGLFKMYRTFEIINEILIYLNPVLFFFLYFIEKIFSRLTKEAFHNKIIDSKYSICEKKKCGSFICRDSLPKNENSLINYSPSFHSKPVTPLFIFGTQIKMFLSKSESFLTLHRQIFMLIIVKAFIKVYSIFTVLK